MKAIIPLLFVSFALLAQTSKNQTDTTKYNLEQITVNATRYSEPIIEIPYSISIIREALKNIRGYSFDEITGTVPGVLAQSRAGNHDVRVTIRGFGARGAGDRSNYGTSRGIRIMIDGIPETEPDGRTSFDLIDLSSSKMVEIIRSNSSATWGNASGGVINVSTIPDEDFSYGESSFSFGSFGFKQQRFFGLNNFNNGKIYFSLSNSSFEGWRENSSSYRTLFNMGFISQLDTRTKLNLFLSGVTNMFHVPGPLSEKEFKSNPEKSNSIYAARDERRHNKLAKIGLTLDHQFNDEHSISFMSFIQPKYLQRSERGTYRDFTRYHIGGSIVYKNHLRFGDDIRYLLVAGIDEAYQDGAILFYNLSSTNGRGEVLRDNKREGANTFGTFIQNEIIFSEKLSLLAGVRYDNVTYYSENFLDAKLGLQKKTFNKIIPKAGITYRILPSLSLFANMGGGVEVPAGNETDPSSTYGQDEVYQLNPLLEPIISTTYEMGTKQIWFLGSDKFIKSISAEASLYRINITNDIIPYRGGRFYFTAGKSHRNGLEIGIETSFKYGIDLKTALTFLNSVYDDYRVDSVHYGNPGKVADYSNNLVAGIPPHFFNFTLDYRPEFLRNIAVTLTANGISKYFVDDQNSIEAQSSFIFNARIGVINSYEIFKNFSVSGFLSVTNLLDTKYIASAFINPDIVNGEAFYLEPALPRSVLFSFKIIIK